MTSKERDRLRMLAAEQLEIAYSEKNLERVALWKRHNAYKGERPTIHIEIDTFAKEVIEPMMVCEDPFARALEYSLLRNFVNMKYFDDDKAVAPYFQIGYDSWFQLFGHHLKERIMYNDAGVETGHHLEHIIEDLEDDFDKITSPSIYGVNMESTKRNYERISDVFGDILPVKITSNCLYAVPSQQVVRMMGMETMMFSMYDYPELFKEMMDRIANDYIAYFKYLEKENALMQNHSFEVLAQGSLCFWEEEEKQGNIKTTDLWGFLDSQETVGISPQMFHEFIFPAYKKIAQNFGRLSYGCCEPVHVVWEDIKTLPNLKKVSISPWCDEAFMAEKLRDSGIIYLRKPSPNYLGVGNQLDEEGFRRHIEKTIKTAQGCKLEIAQRDVYTINNDVNKVKRYVEIVRESIENYWQ